MAIEGSSSLGKQTGALLEDPGYLSGVITTSLLSVALTGFSIKSSVSLPLSFPGQRFQGQPETPSHCCRRTAALILVFRSDHRLKLGASLLAWVMIALCSLKEIYLLLCSVFLEKPGNLFLSSTQESR